MEPVMATPTTSREATAATNESVIAHDDTLEGQLKTVTGVRILGTVRGGIESQRSVQIESGAQVEADITAEEVVIAGTYSGNLTCRNRVEITSTGHVTGKIHTARLFLHEGGFFDGELRMQQGTEEPKKSAESDSTPTRRSRYVDGANDPARLTIDKPAEEPATVEVGAAKKPE